jgi:hypothetical protein
MLLNKLAQVLLLVLLVIIARWRLVPRLLTLDLLDQLVTGCYASNQPRLQIIVLIFELIHQWRCADCSTRGQGSVVVVVPFV